MTTVLGISTGIGLVESIGNFGWTSGLLFIAGCGLLYIGQKLKRSAAH